MEGAINGGSEQASSSDDGQFLVALRKMMKKEVEVMVIHTVQQVIGPIVEDLIRKVVKEEIQSAQEKLSIGGTQNNANEIVSEQRSLELEFSDEVSDPVLTGKEITGKGGTPLEVSLVDKTTGQVVQSGPESSAKVEILVLDASGEDNDRKWSAEDFNSRIIREGDKKKPHFAKSKYIYLKEGVAILCNAKLGHDSSWMKSCKCRLGARIVENIGGVSVQDASTESFMVLDSRSQLYGKHHPPSLSDHVWRLENIGRDGARCKLLNDNNICTVQDFLFLHSIDLQRLQKIVRADNKMWWKVTVDHAQTCIIDDTKIYLYYPSESKMGVIFDAVGGLKGVIHDSHYVLINNLSAGEKDSAHKLLLSAFENRKEITSFPDETSLLHQFPHRSSSDPGEATSSSIEERSLVCDPTISENINGHEPGTTIQTVSPCIGASDHPNNTCDFSGLTAMEEDYEPCLGAPNWIPSSRFSDLDPILGDFCDNERLISLFFPESTNLSEAPSVESHSHHHNNTGRIHLVEAAAVMLRMVRVRKRFMALGSIHVPKRQKT